MARIRLDLALLAAFMAIMCYHFLPHLWHEILATALLLPLGLHLWWNRAFFTGLPRGRWTLARGVGALIALLLLAVFLVATVTGILTSHHLFKDFLPLAVRRDMFLRQLHQGLPYWCLLLVGLHLGWHWEGWRLRLARRLPELAAGKLARALALAIAALGLAGAWLNELPGRLALRHLFETPAASAGGAAYLALLLATLGLFAAVGYCGKKLLGQ